MNGARLIRALKRRLRSQSNRDLQRVLGISHMALRNWERRSVTPDMIAALFARMSKDRLSGPMMVGELLRQFDADTLSDLRRTLDVSGQALRNWRGRRAFTARQAVGLAKISYRAGERGLRQKVIRPIVEFFPIVRARSGSRYSLFSPVDERGRPHPYLQGLKDELRAQHGIYVFFDSRGQAIYAGKARRQDLWKEMNLAFNRQRDVQKIRRVRHPSRRQQYRTSDEKSRQIREKSVPLQVLAHYFSAYQVDGELIEEMESLLVRSFANDLLNKRMERFGHQRSVSAHRRRT